MRRWKPPCASQHSSHLLMAVALLLVLASASLAQDLQSQLAAENPVALANSARDSGDARRGAIVFYQQHLACAKCHIAGDDQSPLGPDLSKVGKEATDAYLIESVLEPSKVIKKGYEPVTITDNDGKTITGLLASEDGNEVVLRDPAQNGKLITIPEHDIDERVAGKISVMPTGQVGALASRQQFLDLLRYLFEIRDGGPTMAAELEPPPSLYATMPLPDYESHIDHAGMIADAGGDHLKRGQAIYLRVCANCHGTHDRLGSLPTSLNFSTGKFKSGNDPYTMYQTITRGFGLMVPQAWMVPQQKYDVINYIRDAYLKQHNADQYFAVNQAYLDRLPKGDTRGPEPSKTNPWQQMDYGPNQVLTLEIGNNAKNFAYKGNAVRLDHGQGGISQGRNWMIYDYDTMRVAAAWSGKGFIDWHSIHFDGRHNIHPRLAGRLHFQNPTGPGWANPDTGSFEDTRLVGRDDRIYGPLPRKWAQYKGMYYYDTETIVAYTVGKTNVLELPGLEVTATAPVFKRTFNIAARDREMILQVANRPQSKGSLAKTNRAGVVVLGAAAGESANANLLVAGVAGDDGQFKWTTTPAGDLRLTIPPGTDAVRFTLFLAEVAKATDVDELLSEVMIRRADRDLTPLTKGGPPRWPGTLTTTATIGNPAGPFAVDILNHPASNPWNCRMRLTGFDFFPDSDRMAVSSWDGSVYLVTGLNGLAGAKASSESPDLTWQRIAAGLFQPLGVKIVDGRIYVTCRDAIYILNDLNGDGEADFLESFNSDHQVTDHFHEFAMGLQTDDDGNFYYAKSARHALRAVVPHHGTLLRVSKDGTRTDIVAKGFRAANGVCVNADGTFIVTDQEGHWNPKNRINWVKPGGFYGNMYGYHDITDSSDEAMEQPLCWITNAFDRSPGELLWIKSKAWGPLDGTLLNLSYGNGKVFVVPHEDIKGQVQGGMCALPIAQFPTGVMRGRFHPGDGQLYCCGMFAWAGSQTVPGGFYRIRYTGKPACLPIGLHAKEKGMAITFSDPVERQIAGDAGRYAVKVWALKRTKNYGSPHINERPLKVAAASVSEDGRTVSLEIPEIAPTWSMEIKYSLAGAGGEPVSGTIHNTIHRLAPSPSTVAK